MWEKLIMQNNINSTSSHFYIMHSQREQSITVFLFLQTKTENNQPNKQRNKPSEMDTTTPAKIGTTATNSPRLTSELK